MKPYLIILPKKKGLKNHKKAVEKPLVDVLETNDTVISNSRYIGC